VQAAQSEKGRLTGERPQQGVTPDSLLALHDAGYQSILARLGEGKVLDLGCGEGFETAGLVSEERVVLGVDYSPEAAGATRGRFAGAGVVVACMDAARLGIAPRSFDWVCSSHIIEHFVDPDSHVAEMARVLKSTGSAFVLTPNAPADFENPFHVHLFRRDDLRLALEEHFASVWVGGLDAVPRVKEDLAARRAKAARVLAIDFLDLRHRIPRNWYTTIYTHMLPLAYRFLARSDSGGSTGICAEDFFVTDQVDDTTPVLFAVATEPRERGTSATTRAARGR